MTSKPMLNDILQIQQEKHNDGLPVVAIPGYCALLWTVPWPALPAASLPTVFSVDIATALHILLYI